MIYRSGQNGVTAAVVASCIQEHRAGVARMDRLDAYYRGEHDILKRRVKGAHAANNRLVCNYAKYITDTAVGYVFGNPIKYSGDEAAARVIDAFRRLDMNTHDAELAKDLSVFGVGYELAYNPMDAGGAKIAIIDPRKAFVVYDSDTVAETPLFGCYYYRRQDANSWAVWVYTRESAARYDCGGLSDIGAAASVTPNPFGAIPLIEYWNNEEGMGDFEPVMSLIDAYNVLASDRVNDKEQFVDAILVIQGGQLPGDEEDEKDESRRRLNDKRTLELPTKDMDAKFLTKTLDESQVEILRAAIAADIHKFSQTPDFTDERFSGNTSGVAIKYKLLSLETLAKVKERFFIAGLRERLKLFAGFVERSGGGAADVGGIAINFNRTLPANEKETAETVDLLKGTVSTETLLGLLPFVTDPAAELARLAVEDQRAADVAAAAFGDYPGA